jgi:thioredoxin reductase
VVEILGDDYAELVRVQSPAGEELDLPAEGTFVELGLDPQSQMVAELVNLDEQRRIIVDCHMRTNVEGIFAAGDVTNTYAEQVLVAVGDGAKAALSVYDYLLPRL